MNPEPNRGPGSLEVLCGPMGSGKSEELIRQLRVHTESTGERSVLACVPQTAIVQMPKLVSRNGTWRAAVAFPSAQDIHVPREVLVVGIDEAHFFDNEPGDLEEEIEDLVCRGVRVVVAGLDMDSNGVPFTLMGKLAMRADTVRKFQGRCEALGECSRPSTRTHRRKDLPTRRFMVGGDECYTPVCLECWLRLRVEP